MNFLRLRAERMRATRTALLAAATGLAMAATAAVDASAAGGRYGGQSSAPKTDLDRAEARLAVEDYEGALAFLEKAKADDPRDADVHNLIGFANRKLGRYEIAGASYETALSLDPRHKGALEYQGELFLKLGQPERAKANLAKLDDICWIGCSEEKQLQRAIAAYEAGSG